MINAATPAIDPTIAGTLEEGEDEDEELLPPFEGPIKAVVVV